MYERFFELRERPFALSPDPEYLYPSRVHQEALGYLRYALESQAGFVVITGEIGSGKTTLLQTLLRDLDSHTTVGRIVNTMLDPRELLESIMLDFGLAAEGRGKPVLLRDLAQFLVDQRLAGRLVLVVIDEAQNLSLAALEELRMLSNLETEKSKLLQVVLIGQPNLRDKLTTPELEQLRQRITVSYHLPPLDADETFRYINHRLRHAATGTPVQFPPDATSLVHARSRGVPRLINIICDATLVFAYAEERREIDASIVREVLQELETTGVLSHADGAAPGFAPAPSHAAAAPVPDPIVNRPAVTASEAPAAPSRTEVAATSGRVLDARNWPPPNAWPSGSEERRHEALDQREELLRQRERELAEQRRVLAEEYRLLRARHQPPAARPGAPGPAPRGAQAGKDGEPENVWKWLKRVMLGVSHQGVVDGNTR
jgi:putative secretion ATPase (PEP-CTERM system associated)